MRTPVPHRSPPARIFAEQKCLATDKVSQICCSAGRSSDILQTSKAVHTRKRVLPKYVEDARLGGHCKSGTPGISKGPQPFCFRRSPEETLSRVSFGQLLPGGSTRRFFAQRRSVGSKKNQLADSCQFKLAPAPREGVKSPLRWAQPNHLTFPFWGIRIKQKRSFYYECIVQRQL